MRNVRRMVRSQLLESGRVVQIILDSPLFLICEIPAKRNLPWEPIFFICKMVLEDLPHTVTVKIKIVKILTQRKCSTNKLTFIFLKFLLSSKSCKCLSNLRKKLQNSWLGDSLRSVTSQNFATFFIHWDVGQVFKFAPLKKTCRSILRYWWKWTWTQHLLQKSIYGFSDRRGLQSIWGKMSCEKSSACFSSW